MSIAESIRSGVLELHPKGYGFLRDPKRNYKAGTDDVYVGTPLLARFGLRPGVRVSGRIEPAHPGNGPRLAELTEIEGQSPESYVGQREFEALTAVDPHDLIRLETGPEPLGMRVMDLLTPVGKGQRRPDRRPSAARARRFCCSRSPPPSPEESPRNLSCRPSC